jgi:ABC-type transporter Mla subunit MlaD
MVMGTRRKQQLIILVVVVLVLAGIGVGLYYSGLFKSSYTLNIVFDDIKGLRVGAPVMFSGYQIGSVDDQSLTPEGSVEVRITIDNEHVHLMRHGILVTVNKDWSPGSLTTVEVGLPEDKRGGPRLQSGSRLEGSGYWAYKAKMAIGDLKDSINGIVSTFQQSLDEIEQYLDSEEMREWFNNAERFFRDMQKAGQAEVERMLEEHGPEIRDQMENLADELEKRGHKQMADDLRRKMEKDFGPRH